MRKASEYIQMSNDELLEEMRKDDYFRSYVLASMVNWHNDYDDAMFREFSYRDQCKFDDFNPSTVVYWTRRYLEKRNAIEESDFFKRAREAERLAEEERNGTSLEAFCARIPLQYRTSSIDDFKDANQPKVVSAIMAGDSFIIGGTAGIGKTRMGWAVTKEKRKKGEKAEFVKMYELMQSMVAMSGNFSDMADVINTRYVLGIDCLIIDEVDKSKVTESSYQNFNYLIDRRCEELKQTVLLMNGTDADSIRSLAGDAVISRFRSKKWKARIIKLGGEDMRPIVD